MCDLFAHTLHTYISISQYKKLFFLLAFSPPFLKTNCYSCFFHWFDWQVRGHVNRYRPHLLSALGLALYSCGMGTRTPRASCLLTNSSSKAHIVCDLSTCGSIHACNTPTFSFSRVCRCIVPANP